MVRMLLLIAIIGSLFFLNAGINFLKENVQVKKQVVRVDNEIKAAQKEMVSAQQFQDQVAKDLVQFYTDFFNNMKLVAAFHNSAVIVVTYPSRDRERIDQSFRPAQYAGIRKVDVQVTFTLHDYGAYPLILNTMGNIERNSPLQIVNVLHKDNFLEFQVTLYGI